MNRVVFKIPENFKVSAIFVAFILFLLLVMGLTLSHIYSLAQHSLGNEVASIVLAVMIAGELFLVGVGLKLGKSLDRSISHHPPKSGSFFARIMRIWDYKSEAQIVEEPALDHEPSEEDLFDDVEALLVFIEKKRYRGKKSSRPPDVRFRAVRDWMMLQAKGSSYTLQEFLEERFGVAPETGMPLVHNQTFYSWRRKFIRELKKLQEKKK
jgi:hypothetical protein